MICNVQGQVDFLPVTTGVAATNAEEGVFLDNSAGTLVTNADSLVRIGIDEFLGRVDILSNTTFSIIDMMRDGSSNITRLFIDEGSAHVSFYRPHIDPDSTFIIQTNTAIVTIMGENLPSATPLDVKNLSEDFSLLSESDMPDNRAAFCSSPINLFEVENFDAWQPDAVVLLGTDTDNVIQAPPKITDDRNIPNFLISAEGETTTIDVFDGVIRVQRLEQDIFDPGGLPSEDSSSGDDLNTRILPAFSRDSFENSSSRVSDGIIAGPGT